MGYPDNLRYSKTHEWLRLDDDIAVVGITDYAVEQLGDIVFIDLPEPDVRVTAEDRFGEIESTKTVSDLCSPVSGEVADVNSELSENLELLQNSPYEAGWLIKVRVADPREIDTLLYSVAYEKHVESEDH